MSTLQFEIEWLSDGSEVDPDELTRGRLLAVLHGRPIWSTPDGRGLEWAWVDLLEWLSGAWAHLEHERGLPHGVPGDARVWRLRTIMDYDPTAFGGGQDLGQHIHEFRERHDLSRGLPGAVVPPLLVCREGDSTFVASRVLTRELPWEQVAAALSDLGDAIAARLAASPAPRAEIARDDWAERRALPEAVSASILAGIPEEEVKSLAAPLEVAKFFELVPEHPEPTETLLAARLASPLTSSDALRALLRIVRAIPSTPSDELEGLCEALRAARISPHQRPYEQGYLAAQWLRRHLQVQPAAKLDVERVLRDLGVAVLPLADTDPALEAMVVWGPRHGPAVLINPHGIASSALPGRRASLAHELAHLLLDREQLTPLVEVLLARGEDLREPRARAFAAELLAPQAIVGPAFHGSSPEEALDRLTVQFDASQEVIAWQARNHARRLGYELSDGAFTLLRGKVSEPERFTRRRSGG